MIRITKAGNIIIIDKIKESLSVVEIASSLRSLQEKNNPPIEIGGNN